MSISIRADGRSVVKYKTAGHWRQKAFRNREEAERFDRECREASGEQTQEDSRLTVQEAVLLFLRNVPHNPTAIQHYQFLICGHDCLDGTHSTGPAEDLATRYVDSLNRRDLEAVRERCRARGNCNATINDRIQMLQAAFNWAVDQDLLSENPWKRYRGLRAEHKTRAGTLEDFARIYQQLPPWCQWICRTCMALCLRPGRELQELEWPAFEWRARAVHVFMPKTRTTKTVYPPAAYLMEAYDRYQEDMAAGYTHVCRGKENRPLPLQTFRNNWNRTRKRLGITIPPYAMRHIAASEMLAGGADLASVAAQLGHKNITTTGAFYTHAVRYAQTRAATMLPDCANLVQMVQDFGNKSK